MVSSAVGLVDFESSRCHRGILNCEVGKELWEETGRGQSRLRNVDLTGKTSAFELFLL